MCISHRICFLLCNEHVGLGKRLYVTLLLKDGRIRRHYMYTYMYIESERTVLQATVLFAVWSYALDTAAIEVVNCNKNHVVVSVLSCTTEFIIPIRHHSKVKCRHTFIHELCVDPEAHLNYRGQFNMFHSVSRLFLRWRGV